LLQPWNVTVRDAVELLGEIEQVRSHAARVPERQDRLTAVLRWALADKPGPEPDRVRCYRSVPPALDIDVFSGPVSASEPMEECRCPRSRNAR